MTLGVVRLWTDPHEGGGTIDAHKVRCWRGPAGGSAQAGPVWRNGRLLGNASSSRSKGLELGPGLELALNFRGAG